VILGRALISPARLFTLDTLNVALQTRMQCAGSTLAERRAEMRASYNLAMPDIVHPPAINGEDLGCRRRVIDRIPARCDVLDPKRDDIAAPQRSATTSQPAACCRLRD
jgi:hypothetical protein